MAEIDLALDDLIIKQKPRRGSGSSGKRRAPAIDEPLTPNRTRGRFNNRSGSFGGGGRGGGRFGGGGVRRDNNSSSVVWINIANLPDTVMTADLQELFQGFHVRGLAVHYNEFGQHMGTADLFVDSRSAQDILREYANIAIDGQKIRFAIVNDQPQQPQPLFGGIINQRFGGGGGRQRPPPPPIRPRRVPPRGGGAGGAFHQRNNSGQSTRTYSRSRSPLNRQAGTKRGAAAAAKQPKSTDELDRELEAYMRGTKHPRIKLDE